MAFIIKRGATRPTYVAQLLQNIGAPTTPNGIPVPNLDTALRILLAYRVEGVADPAAPADMTGTMQLIDPIQAIVEYVWSNAGVRTDTVRNAGDYQAEIWIEWAANAIEVIPNDSFKVITLKPSLNAM